MKHIEFELSEPIQAHGETITKLTLARPKVKHLKVVDSVEGDIEKSIALIAELSGLPPSSVEEIDGVDFAKLSETLGKYLKKGAPKTGGHK